MTELDKTRIILDWMEEDEQFVHRVIITALAESRVPIADFIEDYGSAVGYEPTGMHANKMRDAQAKRDMAFRRIDRWEREGWSHFTEFDIPDWVKERLNYHGYGVNDDPITAAVNELKSERNNVDFAFLNGVLHFSGGGYDDLMKYMWTNGHMSREDVRRWNIETNTIQNCGKVKQGHLDRR